MKLRLSLTALSVLSVSAWLQGCSSDDASTATTAGASGSAGAAGNAGNAGSAGDSGSAGEGGTAGTAGSAATGGTAGTAGTAGASGANGTSGVSGANGTAGTAGMVDCPTGQWAADGSSCVAAGIAPGGCDPAFTADATKGCIPILPAGACAAGTMPMLGHTDCQPVGAACPSPMSQETAGECTVVLPAQDCPAGQMALPGSTTCHAVMDCGTAPWGTIPVDATTQYVQKSYAGSMGASNGTSTRPWTTIQQAITASVSGAVIAVTDGSYTENVSIAAHPVKLWGRCPSMVSITGTNMASSTLSINKQSATEVHGVAVLGAATNGGIGVYGSANVVLDKVWVHDNDMFGLVAQDFQGAASVTLKDSLISGNHSVGIFVSGATLAIQSTVIENTKPRSSDQTGGQGIAVQADLTNNLAGALTLTSSLLSGNHTTALSLFGSTVTVDKTVIQDTQAQASDMGFGRGVQVQADTTMQIPSELTLTDSILTGNREIGLLMLGGKATIDGSVVQNTQPRDTDNTRGYGISAQRASNSTQSPELIVTGSTVAKNYSLGMLISGVKATITQSVIRDTQPGASDQKGGQGIEALIDQTSQQPGDLTLDSSLITGNYGFGLFSQGSKVKLDKSVIEKTSPQQSDQGFGWGLVGQLDPTTMASSELTLKQALVSKNSGVGVVVFGSTLDAEGSAFLDTAPQPSDMSRGWGIAGNTDSTLHKSSDITLTRSVLASNHDTALVLSSSNATLDGTVIVDTQPRASDMSGGRGISIQPDAGSTTQGQLTLKGSLLSNNHELGLFAIRSPVTMTGSVIQDTLPRASDQQFGTGAGLYQNSTFSMVGSVVQRSAQIGLTLYGSTATLHASLLSCNTTQIYGQTETTDFQTGAMITPIAPMFTDDGENSCGCNGTDMTCTMTVAP